MFKNSNRSKGYLGELIASTFLSKKGYNFIDKNHYTPIGEIDLIFEYKKLYIFVEVKLRNNDLFGSSIESLTQKKLNILLKSVYWYTSKFNINFYRVDFIAIQLIRKYGHNMYKVQHIENITL